MIVDSNPTPEAAKPTLVTESGVNSVCNLAPRRYFFIHRGSEVPFFSETESHFSHMLKAMSFYALKRRVEAHHAIRPDLTTL